MKTPPTSDRVNELLAATYADTLNEVLAGADVDWKGLRSVLDFIDEVVGCIRAGELSWQKGSGDND